MVKTFPIWDMQLSGSVALQRTSTNQSI